MKMKGGVLEVLLVSAKGIRNSALIGKSDYYVVVQCGNQEFTSKTTTGEDRKAYWNQKFTFKYPFSDWQNLTHLKLKIMDEDTFSSGDFIGETKVHLGGIITEGNEKGYIELKPTTYNVVLEDDTYEGEIKVGLKFIQNVDVEPERKEYVNHEKKSQPSIYRTILNCWRFQRWKFLFFLRRSNNRATEAVKHA